MICWRPLFDDITGSDVTYSSSWSTLLLKWRRIAQAKLFICFASGNWQHWMFGSYWDLFFVKADLDRNGRSRGRDMPVKESGVMSRYSRAHSRQLLFSKEYQCLFIACNWQYQCLTLSRNIVLWDYLRVSSIHNSWSHARLDSSNEPDEILWASKIIVRIYGSVPKSTR